MTVIAPLRVLLVEWQQRLRVCREAMRSNGDDEPAAQLLRIHERVLSYLLTRYQRESEPSWIEVPTTPPLLPPQLPKYFWYVPPPLVEASKLHPPRSPAELRAHLAGIHSSLTEPPLRRTPWFLRRRLRRPR